VYCFLRLGVPPARTSVDDTKGREGLALLESRGVSVLAKEEIRLAVGEAGIQQLRDPWIATHELNESLVLPVRISENFHPEWSVALRDKHDRRPDGSQVQLVHVLSTG
jgi:hypothetical protein